MTHGRTKVTAGRLFRLGLLAAVVSGAACTPPELQAPAQTVSIVPAAAAIPVVPEARRADFRGEPAGEEARRIADWIVDSGDHRGAPFIVIDKVAARAYAFDVEGRLMEAAPVLLGLARGDDTAPGVGDKPLSAIRVEERTTAAGRFVAELGRNLRGEDVLWVDYDSGLSLHRVLTTNPRERRLQRLASPTPLDNRVSYGCINVPVPFFEAVVRPAFREAGGIVYVLPETRPAEAVFRAYDVDELVRLGVRRELTRGPARAAAPVLGASPP
jgi:hypothetical protein